MSSDLTLTTAALIIFILCAGFSLLRGLTKMLIGTIAFSASAWLAFLVWQRSPEFVDHLTGNTRLWATIGPAILVFFVAFFLIGKIINFVCKPFGKNSDEKSSSWTRRLLRLGFAFVPTSMISVVGAALVHHLGSVDEVRASSENSNKTAATFPQKLKGAIGEMIPESVLRVIDPQADSSRVALAKLIAAQAESPHKSVIDPKTGKPIPRAVIVENAELQSLAREGDFSTLLRHPLLTKALEDPKIKKLLLDVKF
ncbi:MAG: CvpA family protein [Akkermansiaceae bacterium]|nr:CvpA family protein [Akkermansiaceae bacterium]